MRGQGRETSRTRPALRGLGALDGPSHNDLRGECGAHVRRESGLVRALLLPALSAPRHLLLIPFSEVLMPFSEGPNL